MNDGEVFLYPAWKNAVARIAGGAYKPGDLISHAELDELIGIDRPTGRVKPEEWDAYKLRRLAAIKAMESELLQEHNICLEPVHGRGLRVLHPREQTKFAVEQGDKAIRKALRDARTRLVHIDHSALTADERKANVDAIVRTAAIAQSFRQVQRGILPELPKKIRKMITKSTP